MPAERPKRYGARGAVLAIAFSFPLAGLCALVYRFPVPFAGYQSGVDSILMAMFASAFYGLLGGFVVLAVGGYVGGLAAINLGKGDDQRTHRFTLLMSTVVAFLGVFTLAVLDKLIGPW
jgi:hypothetical protein